MIAITPVYATGIKQLTKISAKAKLIRKENALTR